MLKIKKGWGEATLTAAFYLLFFITPLLFVFITRELFEFPKMVFVYMAAAVLTFLYLIFRGGGLPRPSTLLKPFLFLLLSQTLSTFFSTHLYTSFWGYYSRFNGGLASLLSFFLIFLVLSQLIDSLRKNTILIGLFSGGFVISLYAVLQNFGLDKDFWVQDSQARAFSTLGQPNWLAAYLLMILPLSFYFYLEAKTILPKVSYFLLTLLFYLGFWVTFSLSGFLGFLCLGLLTVIFSRSLLLSKKVRLSLLLVSFLLVSLLRPGIFGPKLDSLLKTLRPKISFQLESRIQASTKEPQEPPVPTSPTPSVKKGIDTGEIRLAVWQGALNLWQSSPKNFLIGAGPETFAYNFLPFRPASLNQTTEWDFLYNKAHNYYLDLLTGGGLLVFLAFLFFSFSVVKNWFGPRARKDPDSPPSGEINDFLFYGWATTFVTNFFGWPTVSLSLLFFTYPLLMEPRTLLQVGGDGRKEIKFSVKEILLSSIPFVLVLWLFTNIFLADVSFIQGQNRSQRGEFAEAESSFKEAVSLNLWEPNYHKELSFTLAQRAVLEESDTSLAAGAAAEADRAYQLNSQNSLTLRSLIRTYYLLARLDSKYEKALATLANKIAALSPTDPQARYEAALIFAYLENEEMTLKFVRGALLLKPDYPEARELLEKQEKNHPKISSQEFRGPSF